MDTANNFANTATEADVFTQERFTRSPITQTLIDLLRSAKPGDVITFEQMNKATHENVQFKARHYLATAIKVCRNTLGLDFESVPKVGYTLRSEKDILKAVTEETRKKVASVAKRSQETLGCVDSAKLKGDDKISYLGASAYNQFVTAAGSKRVTTEIQRIGKRDPMKELNVDRFMKAFKGMG